MVSFDCYLSIEILKFMCQSKNGNTRIDTIKSHKSLISDKTIVKRKRHDKHKS
jgi:hypothetical protein